MRRVNRLSSAIHLFVGLGAVAGGWAAITDPQAPLGMPADQLQNSPFTDYFIPGLILFTIIGLGNLVSALMFCFPTRWQGYISTTLAGALVIFIVVQCLMLNQIHYLHVIYFVIGLVQAGLAMIILYEQHQFPATLFKR